jgi:hypothetical protein
MQAQVKPSYIIDATLLEDGRTFDVTARITIEMPTTRELFVHTWFNAWTKKNSRMAEEIMALDHPNYYFRKAEDMGTTNALKLYINGKNTRVDYTDSNEDVLKIRLAGTMPEVLELRLEYQYRLPSYIAGFGVASDAMIITYLFPHLAIIHHDAWQHHAFSPYYPSVISLADYEINLRAKNALDISVHRQSREMESGVDDKGYVFNRLYFEDVFLPEITIWTSNSTSETILTPDGLVYPAGSASSTKLAELENAMILDLYSFLEEQIAWKITNKLWLPNRHSRPFLGDVAYKPPKGDIAFPKYHHRELIDFVVHHAVSQSISPHQKSDRWVVNSIRHFLTGRFAELHPQYPVSGDLLHDPYQIYALEKSRIFRTSIESLESDEFCTTCPQIESRILPASVFRYLHDFLGEKGMKDMILSLKNSSEAGFTDVMIAFLNANSPFNFDALLNWITEKEFIQNYTIEDTNFEGDRTLLKIKNHTNEALPFTLAMRNKQGTEHIVQMDAFFDTQDFIIDVPEDFGPLSYVLIDPLHLLPIENREKSVSPDKRIFVIGKKDYQIQHVRTHDFHNLMPVLGYNSNNRFMAGAIFGKVNDFDERGIDYTLMPMFGFGTRSLVGEGFLSFKEFISSNTGNQLVLTAGIKSYDFFRNDNFDYSLRYIRVNPSVGYEWGRSGGKCYASNTLKFTYFYINEQQARFSPFGEFNGLRQIPINIQRLDYQSYNQSNLGSSTLAVGVEHQAYTPISTQERYVRTDLSYLLKTMYATDKKLIFRFFGSGFLHNTRRISRGVQNFFTRGSIAMAHQGLNDYLYEGNFMARQNQMSNYTSQVSLLHGGGFKTALGSESPFAMSNNWAASTNIYIQFPYRLPHWLPVYIHADAGIFSVPNQANDFDTVQIFTGGISIGEIDGIMLHIPLVFSNNLKQEWERTNNLLSFTLNLPIPK